MLKTLPNDLGSAIRPISARVTSSTWREASPLRAVAEDRDRLALQTLRDEAGDHHPVTARLAWAHRVEQPRHHDGQPALVPVGQAEELVQRLGAGIRPAPRRRRPHHAVVALGEGDLDPLAVDLARRGQEHGPSVAGARLEHGVGAVDDRLDRLDRLLDDQLHAHGAGQVIDGRAFQDAALHDVRIAHAGHAQLEAGPAFQVGDVLEPARAQVVEHQDALTLGDQALRQMTADEARPARHQDRHHASGQEGRIRQRSDRDRGGVGVGVREVVDVGGKSSAASDIAGVVGSPIASGQMWNPPRQ